MILHSLKKSGFCKVVSSQGNGYLSLTLDKNSLYFLISGDKVYPFLESPLNTRLLIPGGNFSFLVNSSSD